MEDPEQAGDSSERDIEKLGRQRPAVFKNIFMEVGFCLSILASNLVSVSPSTTPCSPLSAYSRMALLPMSQQRVIYSQGRANGVH